jgi:hypothetical protein
LGLSCCLGGMELLSPLSSMVSIRAGSNYPTTHGTGIEMRTLQVSRTGSGLPCKPATCLKCLQTLFQRSLALLQFLQLRLRALQLLERRVSRLHQVM